MKDQKESLRSRGVKVLKVGCADDHVMEQIKRGYYEILFLNGFLLAVTGEICFNLQFIKNSWLV